MPPTLTATAADLSADCVLAGTLGGSVDVYAASALGGAWSAVGNRTGDGVLSVPLPAGLVVLYASLTADGLPSNPVFLSVPDAAAEGNAVYTRLRQSARDRILSLGLPLNPAGEMVYLQWDDAEPVNFQFPCIAVPKTGIQERDRSRLNATNDVSYPLPLRICDRRDALDQSSNGVYDYIRQKLVRAFHGVPLATPAENWLCEVEFGPIAQPGGQNFEFYTSLLTVWATCREPRGVGA